MTDDVPEGRGPALACPVCRLRLTLDGRTYRCESGHAFDRTREGYVDLLPVGHGRSGITGDTGAMARARRRFHERGGYALLTERIVERVAGAVAAATSAGPVVAEAGCGTGHYLGAIAAALPRAACFGFDVSREALRVAARAHPRITFVINDVTHRLCLPDASVDVLLDIFAPRNPAEFRRVLRAAGLLLVVIPGETHLAELRQQLPLLSIPPEKRERTLEQLGPAFDPAWEEAVEWRATLDRDEVADLVGMTPSAFHLDDPTAALRPLGQRTEVTFSFRALGFSPRPVAPPSWTSPAPPTSPAPGT